MEDVVWSPCVTLSRINVATAFKLFTLQWPIKYSTQPQSLSHSFHQIRTIIYNLEHNRSFSASKPNKLIQGKKGASTLVAERVADPLSRALTTLILPYVYKWMKRRGLEVLPENWPLVCYFWYNRETRIISNQQYVLDVCSFQVLICVIHGIFNDKYYFLQEPFPL